MNFMGIARRPFLLIFVLGVLTVTGLLLAELSLQGAMEDQLNAHQAMFDCLGKQSAKLTSCRTVDEGPHIDADWCMPAVQACKQSGVYAMTEKADRTTGEWWTTVISLRRTLLVLAVVLLGLLSWRGVRAIVLRIRHRRNGARIA